jgi:TPR repeat protein
MCYLSGDSVEQSSETGVRYLKMAADKGIVGASSLLAKCYMEGKGEIIDQP